MPPGVEKPKPPENARFPARSVLEKPPDTGAGETSGQRETIPAPVVGERSAAPVAPPASASSSIKGMKWKGINREGIPITRRMMPSMSGENVPARLRKVEK